MRVYRIEKAYDREDMPLKDLCFCITGRVMEHIHRPEVVWHAPHLPKVVLTSSSLAGWMSDWMEEGADIPDGVTMRHATAQLLAALRAHLDQVPLNYPTETVVQPSSTAHFHYGFPTVEPLSWYSNKMLSSNLKTAIFQPSKRCHTP